MRIRSIPPITSTGGKVRNPSAPLAGLANISLGRYMSEMKKNQESEENDSSWNFDKHAKSDFNKKTKKTTIPFYENSMEKIQCVVDMIDGNKDCDFLLTLKFTGFSFVGDFDKISDNNYIIPILYNEKEFYLFLKTTGDIFEYEIVSDKNGKNRIFDNEIHIPKLLEMCTLYGMNVELKYELITVSYKKN